NGAHRTFFITVSAVQTVLLLNLKRLSRHDAALRAVPFTGSAADAGIADYISFGRNRSLSDGITFPEDRPDAQVKIFDLRIPDHKHDADFPRVSRIHVGKIGLLVKNHIHPALLLLLWNGNRPCRQADHL